MATIDILTLLVIKMKFKGQVVLIKEFSYAGKQRYQLENPNSTVTQNIDQVPLSYLNYFLALKITEIDGKPVNSNADLRTAVKLPTIKCNNQDIQSELFDNYAISPMRDANASAEATLHGLEPVPYLGLAFDGSFYSSCFAKPPINFAANNLNKTACDKWVGKVIELEANVFELELADFANEPEIKNKLLIEDKDAKLYVSPLSSFGGKSDAIINLIPNEESQKKLGEITSEIYGFQKHKILDMANWTSQPPAYSAMDFYFSVAQAKLEPEFNKILGRAAPINTIRIMKAKGHPPIKTSRANIGIVISKATDQTNQHSTLIMNGSYQPAGAPSNNNASSSSSSSTSNINTDIKNTQPKIG